MTRGRILDVFPSPTSAPCPRKIAIAPNLTRLRRSSSGHSTDAARCWAQSSATALQLHIAVAYWLSIDGTDRRTSYRCIDAYRWKWPESVTLTVTLNTNRITLNPASVALIIEHMSSIVVFQRQRGRCHEGGKRPGGGKCPVTDERWPSSLSRASLGDLTRLSCSNESNFSRLQPDPTPVHDHPRPPRSPTGLVLHMPHATGWLGRGWNEWMNLHSIRAISHAYSIVFTAHLVNWTAVLRTPELRNRN